MSEERVNLKAIPRFVSRQATGPKGVRFGRMQLLLERKQMEEPFWKEELFSCGNVIDNREHCSR